MPSCVVHCFWHSVSNPLSWCFNTGFLPEAKAREHKLRLTLINQVCSPTVFWLNFLLCSEMAFHYCGMERISVSELTLNCDEHIVLLWRDMQEESSIFFSSTHYHWAIVEMLACLLRKPKSIWRGGTGCLQCLCLIFSLESLAEITWPQSAPLPSTTSRVLYVWLKFFPLQTDWATHGQFSEFRWL